MNAYQPAAMLGTLNRHGVEFVVIGDLAAAVYGSDSVLPILQVCVRQTATNLESLSKALNELEAVPRGAQTGAFQTMAGAIDCVAIPEGTAGYDDLYVRSWRFDLDGHDVPVCSIDDLIRMKRAAARPKDLYAVEHLTALKKLIESGAGNS